MASKKLPSDQELVALFLRQQYAKLAERDWTKPGRITELLNTAELVDAKFSGFRMNDLAREVELWLLGDIMAKASYRNVAANPSLLAEMHERVFATAGTVVMIDPVQDGKGH